MTAMCAGATVHGGRLALAIVNDAPKPSAHHAHTVHGASNFLHYFTKRMDDVRRQKMSRSPWVLGRGGVLALSARKSLTKTPPRTHRRKGRPCRAPLT